MVERYIEGDEAKPYTYEGCEGDWVKYEDYAALEARLRGVQRTLLEQAANAESGGEGFVVVRISRELLEQMASECA